MSLLCLRDVGDTADALRKRSASDATIVLRRNRNHKSESSTASVVEDTKTGRKKLPHAKRRFSWASVTPAIIQRRIDNHGGQGAYCRYARRTEP
jgi:hypothetical protein